MHPINVARLVRKYRAIIGLRGEDWPRDATELPPYVCVEQDRPEWAFAGGELLWWIDRVVAAGGAGVRSEGALVNPPGGNILIVCSFVKLSAAGTEVEVVLVNGAPPASFALIAGEVGIRDSRWGISAQPRVEYFEKTTLASSGFVSDWSNSGTLDRIDAIIHPGNFLAFKPRIDNVAFTVRAMGYERPQEYGVTT